MALTVVATGDTITTLSLNQILYYLQQPSGAQEYGNYNISGNCYTSSCYLTCYIETESRNSVPVSAALSTSDGQGGGAGNPSYGSLTMGGLQAYSLVSAATTNAFVGGPHTVQY